jgi:chemotaxis protein MotB
VLEKVASELAKSPNRIVVEGHSDDVPITGSLKRRYPTNWELAAARACRVVRLFQDAGIAGERLHAVSAGPFQPEASNESAKGRSINRRIEIRLLPAAPPSAQGSAGVVP